MRPTAHLCFCSEQNKQEEINLENNKKQSKMKAPETMRDNK